MFITVEGIDGSGKTTAAKIIQDLLFKRFGISAVLTSEFNHTLFGLAGKQWLKTDLDPHTELLLVMAARQHHIEKVILPELKKGNWVICDRYIHSTIAYQGFARELGLEIIGTAHSLIEQLPIPDLVFNIESDPITAKARIKERGDSEALDSLDNSFFERAREGFRSEFALRFCRQQFNLSNKSTIERLTAKLAAALETEIAPIRRLSATNDD